MVLSFSERKSAVMFEVGVFLLIITYILYKNVTRPSGYPPGPAYWPFVGNLISVILKLRSLKCHHAVWQHWQQRYGNVLGLRLASINLVVVSGQQMIREVASKEVFDGRPDGLFYTVRSFGKKIGIVFSDGPSWHNTRRLVLKYLKNFGYNSRSMEDAIAAECQILVERRQADAGNPVFVNDMFNISTINILWRLVAGRRYDINDKRLKEICDLIERSFKAVDMSGGVLNFMPFLRHIIPNAIGYTELIEIHEKLYGFIGDTISSHKKTLDVNKPRDVIDAYLIEMLQCGKNACSEEELQVVCLDLLEAGSETVKSTLVFTMLHLVLNPHVQKGVQEEIDRVVGSTRHPSLADRPRMPYTEAVVLESLRISSVAPVGIAHMASQDGRLGNYLIPKGTYILLALYDLHKGKHWTDADVFKPERFLDPHGCLLQNDSFIAFGLGRRRCIGEALARSELFLFLTHLLQKFHIILPSGQPAPSADPIDGVTLSARPFKAIFQLRH